jgi:hypothetical protein
MRVRNRGAMLLWQEWLAPFEVRRSVMTAKHRRAHEMLGQGGVLGKIVLLPNG